MLNGAISARFERGDICLAGGHVFALLHKRKRGGVWIFEILNTIWILDFDYLYLIWRLNIKLFSSIFNSVFGCILSFLSTIADKEYFDTWHVHSALLLSAKTHTAPSVLFSSHGTQPHAILCTDKYTIIWNSNFVVSISISAILIALSFDTVGHLRLCTVCANVRELPFACCSGTMCSRAAAAKSDQPITTAQ